MYVKNGHKTHVQEQMYLKKRKEKDTSNPHYIPQILTLPLTKCPILTLPLRMTTLISKLLPLFVTSDKE